MASSQPAYREPHRVAAAVASVAVVASATAIALWFAVDAPNDLWALAIAPVLFAAAELGMEVSSPRPPRSGGQSMGLVRVVVTAVASAAVAACVLAVESLPVSVPPALLAAGLLTPPVLLTLVRRGWERQRRATAPIADPTANPATTSDG
jgi:hypothetical protein